MLSSEKTAKKRDEAFIMEVKKEIHVILFWILFFRLRLIQAKNHGDSLYAKLVLVNWWMSVNLRVQNFNLVKFTVESMASKRSISKWPIDKQKWA